MKLLQDRIIRDGKVLPGNIIKVDGFLNHRVDIDLLKAMADEFYSVFSVNSFKLGENSSRSYRLTVESDLVVAVSGHAYFILFHY